jgi:hypothetical protein
MQKKCQLTKLPIEQHHNMNFRIWYNQLIYEELPNSHEPDTQDNGKGILILQLAI